MSTWSLLLGDVRETVARIPDASVQCVVTSPPYWGLRDYGEPHQLGLEPTPEEYVANMVAVFREVRRGLRDDGTLWLNLGDSYAGSWGAQSREHAGKHAPNVSALSANQVKAAVRKESGTGSIPPGSGLKPKDLVGIPWMVAFALRADGWYLRSEIIWTKPNPMPESVTDRPTKAHEQVFLLTKSARYYYDAEAIREEASTHLTDPRYGPGAKPRERTTELWNQQGPYKPHAGFRSMDSSEGRNARSVWTIATKPYPGAHFATFPPELARRCILAGSRPGDTVFDPFAGSGTTGAVAIGHGRRALLCELTPDYAPLIRERCGALLEEPETAHA